MSASSPRRSRLLRSNSRLLLESSTSSGPAGSTSTNAQAAAGGINIAEKLQRMIDSSQLCGRLVSFAEVAVQCLWPSASRAELSQITLWLRSAVHDLDIETPLLKPLPSGLRAELVEVFRHLDRDNSGAIGSLELVASGFMDEQEAEKMMLLYDSDDTGEIELAEFVQMVTPFGFDSEQTSAVPAGKSAADEHSISSIANMIRAQQSRRMPNAKGRPASATAAKAPAAAGGGSSSGGFVRAARKASQRNSLQQLPESAPPRNAYSTATVPDPSGPHFDSPPTFGLPQAVANQSQPRRSLLAELSRRSLTNSTATVATHVPPLSASASGGGRAAAASSLDYLYNRYRQEHSTHEGPSYSGLSADRPVEPADIESSVAQDEQRGFEAGSPVDKKGLSRDDQASSDSPHNTATFGLPGDDRESSSQASGNDQEKVSALSPPAPTSPSPQPIESFMAESRAESSISSDPRAIVARPSVPQTPVRRVSDTVKVRVTSVFLDENADMAPPGFESAVRRMLRAQEEKELLQWAKENLGRPPLVPRSPDGIPRLRTAERFDKKYEELKARLAAENPPLDAQQKAQRAWAVAASVIRLSEPRKRQAAPTVSDSNPPRELAPDADPLSVSMQPRLSQWGDPPVVTSPQTVFPVSGAATEEVVPKKSTKLSIFDLTEDYMLPKGALEAAQRRLPSSAGEPAVLARFSLARMEEGLQLSRDATQLAIGDVAYQQPDERTHVIRNKLPARDRTRDAASAKSKMIPAAGGNTQRPPSIDGSLEENVSALALGHPPAADHAKQNRPLSPRKGDLGSVLGVSEADRTTHAASNPWPRRYARDLP